MLLWYDLEDSTRIWLKHGETKAQEDSTAEPEKVQYQYMAQK